MLPTYPWRRSCRPFSARLRRGYVLPKRDLLRNCIKDLAKERDEERESAERIWRLVTTATTHAELGEKSAYDCIVEILKECNAEKAALTRVSRERDDALAEIQQFEELRRKYQGDEIVSEQERDEALAELDKLRVLLKQERHEQQPSVGPLALENLALRW